MSSRTDLPPLAGEEGARSAAGGGPSGEGAAPSGASRLLPRKRGKIGFVLKWLGLALLGLVLALLALLWVADTAPGHRFLAERIAKLGLASGLRIEIGRIEGSIYGRATLRDLRVYDARGLLFDSPAVALDWKPWEYARNRVVVDSLTAATATLHKRPQFNPSARRGPILPGFDIRLGALSIDRLRVEPAVAGERRFGRVRGRADIRGGRADVFADLAVDGGDRLIVRLDAEPDRDRFDLETRLAAPAGGAIGALLGTDRPFALTITGDGRWSAWKGRGVIDWGGRRVADLDLAAGDGLYQLGGTIAPSLITQGKLAAMTAPMIRVMGRATLEDRRLGGRITLGSRALAVRGEGTLDLARSAFDNVTVTANLLQPQALIGNMTGQRIQLVTRLDGPFETARFDYLLDAPRVAFDRTGFEGVRASGRGRLSRLPVAVPLNLVARRVTGVGDIAGGILNNLRLDGVLRVGDRFIVGDGLKLASDKLASTLSVLVDLRDGRYEIAFSGQLNRYLIPGLGIVDVRTELDIVPGPNGRGTRVAGRAQVWVRRLDNAFLASLTRGLPRIETGLERGPDGVLYLRGLRLVAPGLSLTGNGYRRNDGTFFFEGGGRQAQYGPVRLTLDGRIERPKLALLLERPLDALGLRNVRLDLDPTAEGFAYRAGGGSTLGPFTSTGAILLPRGAPVTIRVAALNVSGTSARGSLTSRPGGFDGRLDVSGGGLAGALTFAPAGGVQRIAADLTANGVRFAGPPAIAIRRGRLNAVALLDPAGASVEATVTGEGISRGNIRLARLAANARLRGGTGRVTASFAGSRARAFELQTVADIAPGRIQLTAQGTIDRRPVRLTTPAVLTREGSRWRLARTGLEFAGGAATVAGLFGDGATELDAQLQRLPLSILDIVYPQAGVGGIATGTVRYRLAGAEPSGRVDLRVRGLTRSGLVVSSRPIDVGLAGVLDGRRAAFRAVAGSGGQVIGRAQGRIGPLANGLASLPTAPLFAQLRYNGAADTLWRLTGVELFDLTGGVAIGADVGGTLSRPQVRGSVRTADARLESPVTGTVLTNLRANGRFNGSRLLIDALEAKAGGGTVSGRGTISLGERLGIDLAVQAQNAVLLNRDDLGATVTGPLTIRSDGTGGVIGGDVELTRSRFVLGRATAAQQVPRLRVREINRRDQYFEPEAPPAPWRLAIKATARNRLAVTGLGLDSEWRADLQLGGSVTAPAILGRADLVRGGYEFAGRRFDLERGVIRFQGAAPPDPLIDILAQANVQGLNATIRVTGTGQRPQIAFASVPALPEDELLSRLLFGTSITNLSAAEALQLGAAVASLQGGGGGLDPINAVRRAVGLDRLRILPADATTGQRTAVAAGKYITRRVYAEVITDGQGYSATRVEFQITRWLSLLSTISTIGRQSVNARVSRDY